MTVMIPPSSQAENGEMVVTNTISTPEAPQPTEGSQAVAVPASTVDTPTTSDSSSQRFTWTIDNFSSFNALRPYSETFSLAGYQWRLLIIINENTGFLSIFLEAADATTRNANFSIGVINQFDRNLTFRRDLKHCSGATEREWGFFNFMPLVDLFNPDRGYIVKDTCVIVVDIVIQTGSDYRSQASGKETGYVGLENQGATCYMNSLLQTLYHIPLFRKAVYHMPTTEHDTPSGSIPLALQRLFYKLQYSDTRVSTKELTQSFGWVSDDAFMHHDAQEFNRYLCEKLQNKMQGTVVDGTIQNLFGGHHMNYLECINVDCKSKRKEIFNDIQLDVKGCHDVYSSFDKYVEVERLEGDNQYQSGPYGLQDAKKGILFTDFPPILQLHLKRFEYDFMQGTNVKVNDRYEFPLQLDLDRENGKYLSPDDADRNVRNLYSLHSVLVHSGGVNRGHYYAYIRPTLSDPWFKFDDQRVTKEDWKKVQDAYGGDDVDQFPYTNSTTNAYMLVYIRESNKDTIICNVDENDIAQHLRTRLKKEQEDKEHIIKEEEETRLKKEHGDKEQIIKEEEDTGEIEDAQLCLYSDVKVAIDEDLFEQVGMSVFIGLVDHDNVRSYSMDERVPFIVLKEEVTGDLLLSMNSQRFWLCARTESNTYRVDRLLTPQDEALPIDEIIVTGQIGKFKESPIREDCDSEVIVFLEVQLDTMADMDSIPMGVKNKDEILLFFKVYNPSNEELGYVGRLHVNVDIRPLEILSRLNQFACFTLEEEIDLFEENIKSNHPNVTCVPIDKTKTFHSSQLVDGDIIWFQKSLLGQNMEHLRYPDIPSYFEFVYNRLVVHFRALEKPKETVFSLELSKKSTYDDVVESIARRLSLDDPSKIRLTCHSPYNRKPTPQYVKYRELKHLTDMLYLKQRKYILYYEVLDIPLPELQAQKDLKVVFQHATKDERVTHTIRVLPNECFVADVINDLMTKVELSHPNAELRLLEIFCNKINKIFLMHEKIEKVGDPYWTLRAEEILEEEKNMEPHHRLIHIYHFVTYMVQDRAQIHNFGEPFLYVIHEAETLAEIKSRLQKKLKVQDDEFSQWKFAFLSMGRPKYLEDTDIVATFFQGVDSFGHWKQYLGLEHSDSTSTRSNEKRPKYEKSVKSD